VDRLEEGKDHNRASTPRANVPPAQTHDRLDDDGRKPAREKARGYAKISHPVLRWLLRSPLAAVAAHWLFQGMLYMDATERWFKLGLDALLTALAVMPLRIWLDHPMAWLAAPILAHTVNFLLNSHLWGVLKHYGSVRVSHPAFESYLYHLSRRIGNEPSIDWSGVYGSLARGQWSATSDLDIRLVRKPGLSNALRACTFVLAERSRALIHRFPLDLYVLDDPGYLDAMHLDERPHAIDCKRIRTPEIATPGQQKASQCCHDPTLPPARRV
jgi:hypothetical protein